MHYLNSHIERLQENLSEIKLKFGNGIEEFDCYFICKIHTSKIIFTITLHFMEMVNCMRQQK